MGLLMELFSRLFTDIRVQLGLVAVVLGAFYLRKKREKKRNLPPGPRPLPILGNLLDLGKDPLKFRLFAEMAKKYGPIFRVQIGSFDAVVLNSIEAARDSFLKRQNDYAGRPKFYSMSLMGVFQKDIVMGDYSPAWALQRKMAHAAIRQYASGKHLERLMHFSFDKFSEILKEQKEPFEPLRVLSLLVYNILASMCFGKRFEFDDPFFQRIVKLNDEGTEAFGSGLLPDFIPMLGPIYDIFPTKAAKLLKEFGKMWDTFLQETYVEHKKNFDPDNLTDFTYQLIQSMHEAEEDTEQRSTLSQLDEGHYIGTLSDMFFAGTDTSRFTLNWVVHCAAAHPEVQSKLQEEVDRVVGRDNRVGLVHRPDLPYCEAVIYEVLRLRPIAAVNLPHKTLCDTTVCGYDIPAGWQVLLNQWSLHMDPSEWDEPEKFKPERFLDESGNLAPKPNSFLPFSTGRRVCVGEALAKTELQLLVAMLFQSFSFQPAPGETLNMEMNPDSGLACLPKSYKVVVTSRQ